MALRDPLLMPPRPPQLDCRVERRTSVVGVVGVPRSSTRLIDKLLPRQDLSGAALFGEQSESPVRQPAALVRHLSMPNLAVPDHPVSVARHESVPKATLERTQNCVQRMHSTGLATLRCAGICDGGENRRAVLWTDATCSNTHRSTVSGHRQSPLIANLVASHLQTHGENIKAHGITRCSPRTILPISVPNLASTHAIVARSARSTLRPAQQLQNVQATRSSRSTLRHNSTSLQLPVATIVSRPLPMEPARPAGASCQLPVATVVSRSLPVEVPRSALVAANQIVATPASTPGATPRNLLSAMPPNVSTARILPHASNSQPVNILSFQTLSPTPNPESRSDVRQQQLQQSQAQVGLLSPSNERRQRLFAPPPRTTPLHTKCPTITPTKTTKIEEQFSCRRDPNWREHGSEMTAERHEVMDELPNEVNL